LKKKKLYEGKAKKLYESEKENEIIQEFKDEVYATDSAQKNIVKGKGSLNNQISSHLFRLLESYHIPTHFIRQLSDREMLVRRLDMIKVQVVIRNVAAGNLVKRYGIEEGKELECPIIEYYLKDEERHDPMINEDHLMAFGHASSDEIKEIHRLSSKINAILKDFFKRRDLRLVDFSLEFGRCQGKIFVGDEISLDTCRFWDLKTNKKIYKSRTGKLADDIEFYAEVRRRFFPDK